MNFGPINHQFEIAPHFFGKISPEILVHILQSPTIYICMQKTGVR